jgi:predicted transglutaminase-like cysteine proteinase
MNLCIPDSRAKNSSSWLLMLMTMLLVSVVLAEGLGLNDKIINWVGKKYGMEAKQRAENWRSLLETELTLEKDKLTRVNNFFNEIPYRDDFENWDNKDYWATPIEMIGVNAADCEDYAIAKYFSLRDMGVPSEKLRITYVKAIEINQAHMVLAYYHKPDAIPLILDNLKPDIRSADKRKDLVPVYSFNAEGLWLAVNRGSGKRLGNASKVKLWSDLREKMKKELSQ